MKISRRSFVAGLGAASLLGGMPGAANAAQPLPFTVAVRSPWMANQVALTRGNVLFLGLPRHDVKDPTPSLGRRSADGTVVAFPGNGWNEWKPGDDGQNAFVYLNSVHIFADDTVWVVDQGSVGTDAPKPGAQKLIQLDADSGKILTVLRFADDILPVGAKMNDLRFHGSTMYITDSGLGALIVHDLSTGKTMRRLSGYKQLMANPSTVTLNFGPGDKKTTFSPPNSDMIEISQDGAWLYWAAPTGPLFRIATTVLTDAGIDDATLATHIEHVADIEFSGGCAMDTLGNFYFSETNTRHISVLSPSGRKAVLASDPSIIRPDGSFISADRTLYVPIKQKQPNLPADAPFAVYAIALPQTFDGITLGGAIG